MESPVPDRRVNCPLSEVPLGREYRSKFRGGVNISGEEGRVQSLFSRTRTVQFTT